MYNRSASGPTITVGIASEQSYVETLLPAGLSTSSFLLNLTVSVYDIYGAATLAYTAVRVTESLNTNVTVTSLAATAAPVLRTFLLLKNFNGALQFINNVAVTSATVNCSVATPCAQYNRSACSSVAHTCGECLSGYIGVVGASNTHCRSAHVNAVHVGSNCSTTNEYLCPFGLCSAGRCVVPS